MVVLSEHKLKHKLKKEGIRLDIRNKFVNVDSQVWSQLSRGAVLSPSLGVFKTQLDKNLSKSCLTSYLTLP